MPTSPPTENPWWKESTIYQIWPYSFLSTRDTGGHGDLRGVLAKLEYFVSLGVDALWLCPMYESPFVDMGYDVSDYETVDPRYGTMADMDELIRGCHARGLRVVLDLVINHTSDRHRWFVESRKGRKGEFADYYIWKDARYDDQGGKKEPNNWGCWFGGSAWEWVEERQQYYMHLFAKEQPELNWEVRSVRQAIYESAIRFWLRKGVDGFRVDTCDLYSKDQRFLDGETGGWFGPGYGNWIPYVSRGPRILEFWHEIRDQILSEFGDIMLAGEGGGPLDKIVEMTGGGLGQRSMSMMFDMDIMNVCRQKANPFELKQWKLSEIKKAVAKTQVLVSPGKQQAWTTVFKENHDRPRSVSTFGSSRSGLRERSAKLLAMWSATLSGTLYLYQGEEIGMTNVPKDWIIDDLRDTWSIEYLRSFQDACPYDEPGYKRALKNVLDTGRDNARTPMQWSSERNGGFATGGTWIRVNENYKTINVAHQQEDKNSLWNYWRLMLKLRKQYADIFVHGEYQDLDSESEQTYIYTKKSYQGRRALVILNFGDVELDPASLQPDKTGWDLVCSNIEGEHSFFQPWEGRIYLENL